MTLAQAQTTLFNAISTGDFAEARSVVARPEETVRLAVHRNTIVRAQIDALAAAYPSLPAAIGAERFESLARDYVRAHPLRTRTMALYGEGLSDFIAAHAQDLETTALADLAALDRAWLLAFCAADADVLVPEQLAASDLTAQSLRLHPSVQLISLRFELYPLWASLRDSTPPPGVAITEAPSAAIIWRPRTSVLHRALSAGDAAFIAAIAKGAPVGDAATHALSIDKDFQPSGAVAGMISVGVFKSREH